MQYRQPCIVGNWKMNGSQSSIHTLIQSIFSDTKTLKKIEEAKVEIVVCPPAPYLQMVGGLIANSSIKLGAQNVHYQATGAYTGEISAAMLRDIGCNYVIIGHSERRQGFHEEDDEIARKFVSAYNAGLIPIVCVGETEGERQAGKAFEVVSRQLAAVLNLVSAEMLAKSLVAYEPVWAIGTGQTATPEQAEEIHQYLRETITQWDKVAGAKVRILYGGSIQASNAAELFAKPNIDGGLVGGASLNGETFLKICEAAIY